MDWLMKDVSLIERLGALMMMLTMRFTHYSATESMLCCGMIE
jgi:hypothetical protein